VPDSDDPLCNTRTTKASLLERLFIAPYFVNYHLEHHLLMCVPCYNLPKVPAILMPGPYAGRMETQPGYLSVLRMATALLDAEDRRGAVVNNARRMRAGIRIGDDQASAGFLGCPDGATGQTNLRSALGQKQTSTACPL
jgi:hypothetical protein